MTTDQQRTDDTEELLYGNDDDDDDDNDDDDVESIWNVMAHGDARERKWRGNWRMEWVASTLHTT